MQLKGVNETLMSPIEHHINDLVGSTTKEYKELFRAYIPRFLRTIQTGMTGIRIDEKYMISLPAKKNREYTVVVAEKELRIPMKEYIPQCIDTYFHDSSLKNLSLNEQIYTLLGLVVCFGDNNYRISRISEKEKIISRAAVSTMNTLRAKQPVIPKTVSTIQRDIPSPSKSTTSKIYPKKSQHTGGNRKKIYQSVVVKKKSESTGPGKIQTPIYTRGVSYQQKETSSSYTKKSPTLEYKYLSDTNWQTYFEQGGEGHTRIQDFYASLPSIQGEMFDNTKAKLLNPFVRYLQHVYKDLKTLVANKIVSPTSIWNDFESFTTLLIHHADRGEFSPILKKLSGLTADDLLGKIFNALGREDVSLGEKQYDEPKITPVKEKKISGLLKTKKTTKNTVTEQQIPVVTYENTYELPITEIFDTISSTETYISAEVDPVIERFLTTFAELYPQLDQTHHNFILYHTAFDTLQSAEASLEKKFGILKQRHVAGFHNIMKSLWCIREEDTGSIHPDTPYIQEVKQAILSPTVRELVFNKLSLLCQSRRGEHAIEPGDLLQEVTIRVLKNTHNFHGGSVKSWILVIAKNIFIDHTRRIKKKEGLHDDIDILKNTPDESSTSVYDPEIVAVLKEAIETLPEEQQLVIIRRMFADLSFAEIAAITKESINTCLGRMRYALRNLRRNKKLLSFCGSQMDLILSHTEDET